MSILFYIVQHVVKNIQSVVFKMLAIPLLPDLKKLEEISNTGTSNKPTPNSSLYTKLF
jgi:hypothetical protein